MLFNSFDFLFFFVVVTTLYFSIPHQWRWLLLLAASCIFYMAFVPLYILILGFTIVIDYFAGIYIEGAEGKKRKAFLVISLVANIGVLAVFKYYNFLNENLSFLLHGFGLTNSIPYLSILLPIGLSFHTFQAMSYTIEVYRGNQKAERHFGIYALYVMFYPQLVAGPIERPQNLLHQFKTEHAFNYAGVVNGLKLMLWGLFKKIVIADRLAIFVNSVFNHAEFHNGSSIALATVFFAFQIYCDFSGYSDIAIGAAKVMGFDLMPNFNRPYFSLNVSEFWKRWHISLSTWFKDYLYIPLGGNRVKVPRWYFNLFFVFLVSGFWHGASWTYIIWGALHGFYLVFALITKRFRERFNGLVGLNKHPKLHSLLSIFTTFLLACFAWIFFRANSVSDALTLIKNMSSFGEPLYIESPSILIYSCIGLFILLFVELKQEFYPSAVSFLENKNTLVRQLSYLVIIILVLLIGVFDGGEFIYFQF